MKDLTERLRRDGFLGSPDIPLRLEAAVEIERLQAEIQRLLTERRLLIEKGRGCRELQDENAQLRLALQEIQRAAREGQR